MILISIIRPYISIILTSLKLLSELNLLSILGIMMRGLVLFENLREDDQNPNIEEVEEYIQKGKILNGLVISYMVLQILIFIFNFVYVIR